MPEQLSIVFVSNFMNHHQLPLSKEIMKYDEVDYYFIATEREAEEQLNLGYEKMNEKYGFIINYYQDEDEKNKAIQLINSADIVIFGSAPEELLSFRKQNNKIIFRYSERIRKKGEEQLKFLYRVIKLWIENRKDSNIYMLCAGAYVNVDFKFYKTPIRKYLRWGYFPEFIEYDSINNLLEKKEKETILWVGRLIDWKHPEYCIDLANQLIAEGRNFNINIVGNGIMKSDLQNSIDKRNLKDYVHILGPMTPQRVRNEMEKSGIFIFTSDRNEGWGAVLNEAMNSGCAVVANKEIGSVPYLLVNNNNGLIYSDKTEFIDGVKSMLDDFTLQNHIGREAYHTIKDLWNPKIAADRLVQISKLLANKESINIYKSGPCSIE